MSCPIPISSHLWNTHISKNITPILLRKAQKGYVTCLKLVSDKARIQTWVCKSEEFLTVCQAHILSPANFVCIKIGQQTYMRSQTWNLMSGNSWLCKSERVNVILILAYSEAQQTGFIKKKYVSAQVTSGQWLIQWLEHGHQDSHSHPFNPTGLCLVSFTGSLSIISRSQMAALLTWLLRACNSREQTTRREAPVKIPWRTLAQNTGQSVNHSVCLEYCSALLARPESQAQPEGVRIRGTSQWDHVLQVQGAWLIQGRFSRSRHRSLTRGNSLK